MAGYSPLDRNGPAHAGEQVIVPPGSCAPPGFRASPHAWVGLGPGVSTTDTYVTTSASAVAPDDLIGAACSSSSPLVCDHQHRTRPPSRCRRRASPRSTTHIVIPAAMSTASSTQVTRCAHRCRCNSSRTRCSNCLSAASAGWSRYRSPITGSLHRKTARSQGWLRRVWGASVRSATAGANPSRSDQRSKVSRITSLGELRAGGKRRRRSRG